MDMVCIDCRIVDVFYQQTTITGHHPYVSFDLFWNGTLQGVRTNTPGSADSDLRSCVLNRIDSFFCAFIDDVIFNMDTGAAIGFDPSPLHVEHQMREDTSYRMAVECPVTVRMTTVSHCSDFDHFNALWLTVDYRKTLQLTEDLVQRLLLRPQESSPPSNFQLRVILEPNKALSDVKVNIKELVRYLTMYPPPHGSTIELSLGTRGESHKVSMARLGGKIVLHLTELDVYVPIKPHNMLDDALPDIWIYGYGSLLEMERTPRYKSHVVFVSKGPER